MHDTETLLCAALRGESPAWPVNEDAGFTARFLERASYHGVLPLLHHLRAADQGAAPGWPREVLETCHRHAIGRTMWELRHQVLLSRVLTELAAIGARPLLFKGTALAYGLYPNPVLRDRGDSDLIVALADRERVAEILESLGFHRGLGVSGDFVSYQATFTLVESNGAEHSLDLHWRINNSQLLAKLFTHEELWDQAQALPELCPRAFAASPVHALLLACMHRSGHKEAPYYVDGVAHYSGDRLIWFYDIHLLAEKLTQSEWTEFLALASQKGLRAVCLEGLEKTRSCLGTRLTDEVIAGLSRPGAPEAVAEYLECSASRRLWLDFRAIDGLSGKAAFLFENLFPPVAYMRERYPHSGGTLLPWLYLKRATGGLMKRFKRGSLDE
jgi:hypothetical protein